MKNDSNLETKAMWSNNSSVGGGNFNKSHGASIRCLKD